MSLTLELRTKDSAVRTFIDREFSHLRQLSRELNKGLRHFDDQNFPKYPNLYTYSLVGTAID